MARTSDLAHRSDSYAAAFMDEFAAVPPRFAQQAGRGGHGITCAERLYRAGGSRARKPRKPDEAATTCWSNLADVVVGSSPWPGWPPVLLPRPDLSGARGPGSGRHTGRAPFGGCTVQRERRHEGWGPMSHRPPMRCGGSGRQGSEPSTTRRAGTGSAGSTASGAAVGPWATRSRCFMARSMSRRPGRCAGRGHWRG